ncbi:MAG: hypothetical protein ACTSUF_03710 [Candidatus Heimdallarchaeaceae archaeon]
MEIIPKNKRRIAASISMTFPGSRIQKRGGDSITTSATIENTGNVARRFAVYAIHTDTTESYIQDGGNTTVNLAVGETKTITIGSATVPYGREGHVWDTEVIVYDDEGDPSHTTPLTSDRLVDAWEITIAPIPMAQITGISVS